MESVEVIDLQGLLNEAAEEAQFEVFLNSNIVLKTGNSDANVLIQNAESNNADCQVYLYLNDTGECIYESDIIPSGFKVEYAPLSKVLEAGVYSTRGEIHMLNEDGTDKSVVSVNTTVTVLK